MNTDDTRRSIVGPIRSLGNAPDLTLELPGTKDVVIIDVAPLNDSDPVGEAADVAIAKRFVDGVLAGQGPAAAAAGAGVTLSVIKRDTRVRKYIRDAKRKYEADADEVREAVVLRWLEMAFDDPDPKLRLVALRELSLIPEIGLKTPRVTGGGIERRFSAETEEALNSLGDE